MVNFTNIRDHPTNNHYNLYLYYDLEHADFFQQLLEEENVEFERNEETDTRLIIYFAIRKTHHGKVNKLNFRTLGKFRDPFIPNRTAGWIVIIGGMLLLAIAFLGYFLSR